MTKSLIYEYTETKLTVNTLPAVILAASTALPAAFFVAFPAACFPATVSPIEIPAVSIKRKSANIVFYVLFVALATLYFINNKALSQK